MSWVRGWCWNDPRRPHLPMQHLFCPVLGLPTSGRTHRQAQRTEQRRGTGGNLNISIFRVFLPNYCNTQDVVISIEGMAEVEEETFTEEINTFVISVDADGNESGTCVAEPSIKYTLVEWVPISLQTCDEDLNQAKSNWNCHFDGKIFCESLTWIGHSLSYIIRIKNICTKKT